MEIVTEPDMRSAEEARQFLMKLRTILQYLGVSTGNMEEGSFRCDANMSIRPEGSPETYPKVEVKNINSFKAVFRALEFEASARGRVVEKGGRLRQETRGWADDKGITQSQRSKEYAHDYRYFPEPDLPPLNLSPAWVREIEAGLPELPEASATGSSVPVRAVPCTMPGFSPASKGWPTTSRFAEGDQGPRPGEEGQEHGNWLLGEFSPG
jgi:aspartyl-tRNA(Asn)/glutamyl-tRNA(Gln) amidotransferase subunit B